MYPAYKRRLAAAELCAECPGVCSPVKQFSGMPLSLWIS